MHTFKCYCCGQEYESTQTEEELEKQLQEEFPDFKKEDCGDVCEDCYQKYFAHLAKGSIS